MLRRDAETRCLDAMLKGDAKSAETSWNMIFIAVLDLKSIFSLVLLTVAGGPDHVFVPWIGLAFEKFIHVSSRVFWPYDLRLCLCHCASGYYRKSHF